jgi:hypothetical protein
MAGTPKQILVLDGVDPPVHNRPDFIRSEIVLTAGTIASIAPFEVVADLDDTKTDVTAVLYYSRFHLAADSVVPTARVEMKFEDGRSSGCLGSLGASLISDP